MSYRIRLCLTHIISASVAGFSVWYGLQMSGPGRIACTILYAAGAAVPVAIAAWWFTLGLRRLEVRLTTTSANSLRPGLPELDALEERVCESLTRQRALGRDVEELLKQLAPPDTSGSSVPDGSLLSDTLSALARSSTQDVGRILAFAADISRGAHDAHLGAQEQGRTVAQTIKSVEELSGNIDRVAHNAQAAR